MDSWSSRTAVASGARDSGVLAATSRPLSSPSTCSVRTQRSRVGRTGGFSGRTFVVPTRRTTRSALREAHVRAEFERVEIACGGGVGRTGTAMALLAVMSGVAPDKAVAWVRENYHPRAVETRWQRQWVRKAAERLGT